MQPNKSSIRFLPPVILALALIVVYLATLAPGLTWANYGLDGGDFIAAAASGGVAHPTGYPFYLLVARLFQFLPVGSLAFRTNLLSAVAATGAALLAYGVVIRSFSPVALRQGWVAGLVAGLAFGLSPLLWSQAVITEVYALNSLFVALILFLLVLPLSGQFTQKKLDCFLGLTLGLALGNHLTIIFLLPVVLLTTIHIKSNADQARHWFNRWLMDLGSLWRRSLWILTGLLVYLTLPLRALSHPPVNWGNPVTLTGFEWLVSGALYQRLLVNLSLVSILERLRSVAALLLAQFGIVGLSVSLVGLIVFFTRSRLNYSMIWIVAGSTVFAIAYASQDAFLYLIPTFLCFSIWLGIGLGRLMEVASRRRFTGVGPLLAGFFLLILAFQTWKNWSHVDASHDQHADSFGNSVLLIAPTDALVFANGDAALFSLWYFQYALHERPDLAIISPDLLQFDWYLQTLHATYPDLSLLTPLPFTQTVVEANLGRPVCYVQYIQAPQINCLPAAASQLP